MISDYHQICFDNKDKMLIGVGLLLTIFICSQMFYQNLVLLFVFPLLFPKVMKLCEKYAVSRRKKKLLLEFRDFLFSLSTSFATGRHLLDGLKEAEQYLLEIHGKHGILQGELHYMIKAIDETGASDLSLMRDFATRAKLDEIYLFADVFRACREAGGDLSTSMHKTAFVIGEKISLEQEIRMMVSQKKLEGRMITCMPFLIIAFLRLMSPGYLEVMYTTAEGRLLMTISLVFIIFAYLWMERMTNVEL